MRDKGHYDYPAWCQMETALEEYEEDRKAFLAEKARSLGPEGEKRLEEWNAASDRLIKGVQELVGVDTVGSLRTVIMAQSPVPGSPDPLELLEEHVCVTFAWEAMNMLDGTRERFWKLLGSVRNRKPTPHAKAFLERVGRCYLFGFDAECILMCRAVLDRELKAEISDGDVVAWWHTTRNGGECKRAPLNLWGRIRAACHSRRIANDCKDAADEVRKIGNDAVHKRPLYADALPYIQKTVQVLDALAQTKQDTEETGSD